MKKLALHWRILIAMALAVGAGLLTEPDTAFLDVKLVAVYDFLGTLFINALKMLIVPLVASAMINGIGNIGSGGALGRLGFRTVLYYFFTMVTAVLIAVVLVNIVRPGLDDGNPVRHQLGLDERAAEVAASVKGGAGSGIADVVLSAVPENIVQAAAGNEMLAVIFFSLLFGYFMTRIQGRGAEALQSFWEGVFEVMMRMTHWVLRVFAPIGVFGLVAGVVTETGFDAAKPLFVFALTVVAALLFHAFVTLPLMLMFIARVNPWHYLKAVAPALLTAFTTSSSNATLPVNMEVIEKNVGVSNKTTSFVLPLGATINMDGTALYECAAALFIAQAYGLDLSFGLQFTIAVTALLTAVGVAGIPSASLVAIAVILTAVGLPAEAIGILFVFDRPLDMARTAVNVMGDGVAATIVARLEGESGGLLGNLLQGKKAGQT